MSAVRGCLAQIGCLTVLVGAGAVLWLAREPAAFAVRRWIGGPGGPGEPVPVVVRVEREVAESVEERLAALGERGAVRFDASEVQSWVTYQVEPWLPDYIHDVRVTLLESSLRIDARVETRRVPGIEALGPIIDLVGDTAEVTALGDVDGVGAGRGAVFVERMLVGTVPLPDRVRDRLLAPIRVDAEGLAANAVPFPLPPPAWDVAVRDGGLVLRSAALDGDAAKR